MLKGALRRLFAVRTRKLIYFDYVRFRARLKNGRKRNLIPESDRLHLGSGKRSVSGWLNVDLVGSDFDVDLAAGHLPWSGQVFDVVLSQHLIEHLELETQVVPLLKDLFRVMKSGGEIWLSTPDMKKIARSYLEHDMVDLLADRQARFPDYGLGDMPTSQMVNDLFHQDSEHKNLFDFALLEWALQKADFENVEKVDEATLLRQFPEFPPRHDDAQALYVRATRP